MRLGNAMYFQSILAADQLSVRPGAADYQAGTIFRTATLRSRRGLRTTTMLYVGRYTTRRTSRAKFFLRASLGDAWSALMATPPWIDDPFANPIVQERVGVLIASVSLGGKGNGKTLGAH